VFNWPAELQMDEDQSLRNIEGIPLLVAVPEPTLDNWRELVGGMGTTIGLTGPEMRAWWSGVAGW